MNITICDRCRNSIKPAEAHAARWVIYGPGAALPLLTGPNSANSYHLCKLCAWLFDSFMSESQQDVKVVNVLERGGVEETRNGDGGAR